MRDLFDLFRTWICRSMHDLFMADKITLADIDQIRKYFEYGSGSFPAYNKIDAMITRNL